MMPDSEGPRPPLPLYPAFAKSCGGKEASSEGVLISMQHHSKAAGYPPSAAMAQCSMLTTAISLMSANEYEE